jgi:hypothetical protein
MNLILSSTMTIIEIVHTYCMQHLLSLQVLLLKKKRQLKHLGVNRSHDCNGSMINVHRRSKNIQHKKENRMCMCVCEQIRLSGSIIHARRKRICIREHKRDSS